ncbi:hypothetical protein F5880DRAFT_698944 [Lentinula raphanica]|nr:hypothetical protein F5880DRAFT_698944 [Lentinula raphanica]
MYLISLTLFTISITTPVACRGFFRCYEACSNLTGVPAIIFIVVALIIAFLVLLAVISALVRRYRGGYIYRTGGSLGSSEIQRTPKSTELHTSGSLHEPEPSYWRRDYRHHHDLVEGTGGIGEGSGAV